MTGTQVISCSPTAGCCPWVCPLHLSSVPATPCDGEAHPGHSILPSQVGKWPVKPLSCHHFPAQAQLGPRWDMWCRVVGFIRHPWHCQAGKGARVHVLLLFGEWWLHLGGVFCCAGERGERRWEGNCPSQEVWKNTLSRNRASSPKQMEKE